MSSGPHDTSECTEVNPRCPVEASIYGYYPNLAANVFFAGFFAVCFVIQLIQGIRYRTNFFTGGLLLGCLTEVLGYSGRIIMHDNPFSPIGFNLQICCLIIAPAFLSASIYVTLRNVVMTFGPQYSRLRPGWYTWMFMGADLLSLILQGAGGGLAASAEDQETIDLGSNLMLAGIIWQVISLAIFAICAGDYFGRVYRNCRYLKQPEIDVSESTGFKLSVGAISFAFLAILVRCIYRIPEMSGGWRNEVMQNETDFIILEGAMIVIAVGLLTVIHPGHFCPCLVGMNRPTHPEAILLDDKSRSSRGS
jgi:hypothetical protein